MILQYRVCPTKHILLFFSGLFLGISQILLVEGSITATSAHVDLKSTARTGTHNTSIYDLQNQSTSTEKPTEALTVQATSEPTNGSLHSVSYTVSEAPDRTISETTSDKLLNSSSTIKEGKPPGKQDPETTGILIGCLVVVLFIIIISCLAFNLKKKKKKSYSLKYNKSPEDSGIPLNNMKA